MTLYASRLSLIFQVSLFQKLVCFHESDAERNVLIMKTKLSILYLLIDQQKPVASLLQHLSQIMNSFNINSQVSVVHVFVNNLRIIINCCDNLPADLHIIFGKLDPCFCLKNKFDNKKQPN